ncbi:MAG: hypothetical protein RMY34_32925 [Aulosira sp. DedQUE10]|nr:hypothetical protein [Aulosira sp. DedQUE10]
MMPFSQKNVKRKKSDSPVTGLNTKLTLSESVDEQRTEESPENSSESSSLRWKRKILNYFKNFSAVASFILTVLEILKLFGIF